MTDQIQSNTIEIPQYYIGEDLVKRVGMHGGWDEWLRLSLGFDEGDDMKRKIVRKYIWVKIQLKSLFFTLSYLSSSTLSFSQHPQPLLYSLVADDWTRRGQSAGGGRRSSSEQPLTLVYLTIYFSPFCPFHISLYPSFLYVRFESKATIGA